MKYIVCANCGNSVSQNEFLLGKEGEAQCHKCHANLNEAKPEEPSREKRWSERITNEDIKELFF